MATNSLKFTLSGYHLGEELCRNAKTVMYRGRQTDFQVSAGSRSVIIKILLADYPSYQDLQDFRHHYAIAKDLDIPGILRPYRLEDYDRGYALVMEDFGGISLVGYYQSGLLSCIDILHVGIQLASTLHDLDRQQIVDRDIKPANIFINPVTKQVKIVDLSMAAQLPCQIQEMYVPNRLAASLAYLSPEQTGRIDRGIDNRTDFYALGVTLYELLTGKLPFEVSDASCSTRAYINYHLDETAVSADLVNAEVPPVVAQIVAKLMAKNPEDRYQTALGLKYDLECCVDRWQSAGKIEEFELGQRDISDRFVVSERLYGREIEVNTLLAAFDRVASPGEHRRSGSTEMVLVTGASGIGKTAIIDRVRHQIIRQHGYFIAGKFDRFNRDLPLSALIQAFRDLIGQLMRDSSSELVDWKNKILAAVGKNGRVLIEMLPELAQIIGTQPPVAKLTGTAAQNRFNWLFQKFIEVFATSEHSLTICLDDLQWADSASLHLLTILMGGNGYLLLVGAYRDGEVSPIHPLMLMRSELQQAQINVQTINLQPLAFADTNQLVADTLHCTLERAEPLTTLIDRKTHGNPLFITQLLKALYADGAIKFRQYQLQSAPAVSDWGWECDLVLVKALCVTDDIVEFMTAQLQKLPSDTQQLLALAACIGNRFDLETLAIVSEYSQVNASTLLWPAIQAGLILPTSQIYQFFQSDAPNSSNSLPVGSIAGYRFLHDRVHQAAESLIPHSQKQATHLQIGRLLFASTTERKQSERLFEIVNHYNIAIDLISSRTERDAIAQLNLAAALKAIAATEAVAAFEYARVGTRLLGTSAWQKQYQLALALHETVAEATFLKGDFDAVPTLVQLVLERTQTQLDRVKTYETIVQLHTIQKQYQQAISSGLEILSELGIKLSFKPNQIVLSTELVRTKLALAGKSHEKLLNSPVTVAPLPTAQLRLLHLLAVPAFFCSQELMVVLATSGIQIALKSGNTPWVASFYNCYSLVIGNLGDLKQSYWFGQLALSLADRFGNPDIIASVKATVPLSSQIWQQDFRSSIPILDQSIVAARDSGNLIFLGAGALSATVIRFYSGVPLDEVATKIQVLEQVIVQSKDECSRQLFAIYRQAVITLQSTMPITYDLLGTSAEEATIIAQWQEQGENASLAIFYRVKNFLAYLFADISTSLSYADAQLPYSKGQNGMAQADIFPALARLAAYPTSDKQVKNQLLDRVSDLQQLLRKCAQIMPGNFQHKYDLITAEKCRVVGDIKIATKLYDLAIEGAKAYRFLHEEALANELAAKFYQELGRDNAAATYMQSAYYCYARWGAKAKIDDLERHYPQFLTPILQARQTESTPLSTLAASSTRQLVTNPTRASLVPDRSPVDLLALE